MKYFLLAICIFSSFKALSAQYNILDVGLMDQGRPPYFSLPTETDPATGLYIDILDAVGRETGVKFRYRFLPQARIRHLMNHYRIDVEPGIAEEWRRDKLELQNSIYTLPILTSSEVIVYHPSNINMSRGNRELTEFKPCSILGFADLPVSKGEPRNNKQINTQQVLTEPQLLQMIQNRRCDFAIFPEDVIKPKLSQLGLIATDSVATFDLKLRFTDQHSLLLPKINQVIKNMVDSGELEEIILKYRGLSE